MQSRADILILVFLSCLDRDVLSKHSMSNNPICECAVRSSIFNTLRHKQQHCVSVLCLNDVHAQQQEEEDIQHLLLASLLPLHPILSSYTSLHYTVLKLPESSSNVILPPHFLFHIALQSLLHESTPGWCLFAYLPLKAMNAKSKSLQRAQNTCCVVVSGNTESVLMLTNSDVFLKQLYAFLDQKKLLQIKLSNLCNKYMHFWRRKFGGLEKGQIKGMELTMGIDEDGSSTTKRGQPGFLGNHLMMALSSAPDSTLPQCKASMQCTCTMAETWLHCPASK